MDPAATNLLVGKIIGILENEASFTAGIHDQVDEIKLDLDKRAQVEGEYTHTCSGKLDPFLACNSIIVLGVDLEKVAKIATTSSALKEERLKLHFKIAVRIASFLTGDISLALPSFVLNTTAEEYQLPRTRHN
ncbi:uncharacterized protein LOC112168727 [Rosa chinensis]|uniref:uncharacterized protein LOC112168727 n=1 Tax=Rosa chinensis TaxID=74649 RepID=UPI001AD8D79F|nr:uncharacterized protein LOC112168727 [Rosa chinensis]XP_040365088.1 uncharacterized protein LOC112168727 [Rosa chinensis]XP_040365089.1 uncharacterized protein LOC112168727 [Rosa chinensis]